MERGLGLEHGRRLQGMAPAQEPETAGRVRCAAFVLRQGFQMCSSIKEFDVHARGVVNLVETWKREHAAVRVVWKLEDLTGEWLKLAGQAHDLREHYCEHSEFPNSAATYSYFVGILDGGVQCGREIEDLICMFETEGYSVEGADRLRREIDRLQEIIDEDRFATNASFDSGVLDDWN